MMVLMINLDSYSALTLRLTSTSLGTSYSVNSTQQRHLLQVGEPAQRSGSSALSTFFSLLLAENTIL
ncbi:MAG: hypothetical protein KAF91_01905 [Nostoc sp. TH1S01]|nr:hypothetical protein [Nostoc sp. TH1S01]